MVDILNIFQLSLLLEGLSKRYCQHILVERQALHVRIVGPFLLHVSLQLEEYLNHNFNWKGSYLRV